MLSITVNKDISRTVKIIFVDSLTMIAKNTGMRHLFLAPSVLHPIIEATLQKLEEKDPNEEILSIFDSYCKLLCTLSSIKNTKFYIPGETASSDQLRK
jgi:hypothetical protein